MSIHRKIEGVRLVLTLALFALGACTTPQYETVNDEVLADIQAALETASGTDTSALNTQPPEEVLQALVPGLTLNSVELQPVEERFDFAVQEPMEAREFFSLLTTGTDYSVAVHPGVNGAISALDLKNVTIQEALDQVSDLYGYSINRSGNIFQVTPGGLQTRIFKVDYLNVNRTGNSNMSVVTSGLLSGGGGGGGGSTNGNSTGNSGAQNGGNFGGVGGGVGDALNGGASGSTGGAGGGGGGGNAGGANITTTSESDYWADLEGIILSIIGSSAPSQSAGAGSGFLDSLATVASSPDTERAVTVIPQTGMIVVRAYPDELDQVADFLAQSQDALQRQVVLEAKILEVTLNEHFQAGIDLSLLDRVKTDNNLGIRSSFLTAAQEDVGTGNTSPLDGVGQAFQLAYDASDFDAVIRLLETQGNVQVISSPRITTLNNQKAVFKVGDEEYFSTNPTSSTTQGGNSTTSNSNANLQPFFSGIALDVTPQISAAGDIILHIHPLLNSVVEDRKVIGDAIVPLAKSDTRESDSIARARNGEVVIISGLMQTRARGSEEGIPGARDIPVVGNAFERTERNTEKTELVILLRAIVDEGSNMQQLIQDHTDSFDTMRRQIDPYYR